MKMYPKLPDLLKDFPTFEDLPFNSERSGDRDLFRGIAKGKHAENMLLFGKNGSGKSSLASLLAHWHSQSTGFQFPALVIDAKRIDLKSLTLTDPTCRFQYGTASWCIINELDKIDTKIQHSLLNIIDQAIGVNFIITANDLTKIDRGIDSRCGPIEIIAPSPKDFAPYAERRLAAAGKPMALSDIEKEMNEVRGDLRTMTRRLERLINL